MGEKDRQSSFLNFGFSGVIILNYNNMLIKITGTVLSRTLFQEISKMEIGMSAELILLVSK